MLAIPFKRRARRIPEYLERSEIQSLFHVDCQTLLGQRDDALLRMLYNTGMRAQELVDLDVNQFSRPYSVRIYGKGREERTCPLWKETLDAVRKYLERRSVRFTDAAPLFDRRGHTAHRWRHRSYSYSWASRGTGRASVASGTNAVRGRCVHEPHGPR
jgi:site-specific recombinase XerD